MDREHLRERLQERLQCETATGVSLGGALREARESCNIKLQEIADSTKIGQRYFKALEADDWSVLPGGIYGKNYIRAYARSIGLDPDWVLEAFIRVRGAGNEESPPDEPQATLSWLPGRVGRWNERGRLPRVWIVFPVFLLLVGIEGWAFFQGEVSPQAAEHSIPVESPISAKQVTGSPSRASAVPLNSPRSAASAVAVPIASSSKWSIPDSGIGTAVVEHELQNRGDRFPEGDRVWFWTRVVGAEPGERLWHVWIRDGEEVARVELEVGGPSWRTQSRKSLKPGSSGQWSVEARDSRGRVLAAAGFTCWKAETASP